MLTLGAQYCFWYWFYSGAGAPETLLLLLMPLLLLLTQQRCPLQQGWCLASLTPKLQLPTLAVCY